MKSILSSIAMASVMLVASAQEFKPAIPLQDAQRFYKANELKPAIPASPLYELQPKGCWDYSRIKAGVVMQEVKPTVVSIKALGCSEKQAEIILDKLIKDKVQ